MRVAVYLILVLSLIGNNAWVDCQAINGLDNKEPVVGEYYKPGVTAAQILRARGYLAEEFFFKTDDDYFLSIIRGRNPLMNNGQGGLADKEPILFIHGVLSSAALWVINSEGAQPRDFTNIQVNETSKERLIELVGNDPGTFALPIMFMNFGHEVWLLNRRGTLESENRVGSTSRTLVDAFRDILPTFFGGGFGPNAGLGVFDFTRSSGNSSGNSPGLTKAQEDQLASFDDEQLMKFFNDMSTMNSSSVSQINRDFNNLQDKSMISEFLQPFINLPGALTDFGTLIKRFIRTFDPKFWTYSLDEQARFDVTAAVNYVLEKSGRKKVTLVGHSAGCVLILLKLSEDPSFADKVSKAVFLAAGFPFGEGDNFELVQPLLPFIQSYVGAIPFPFMSQQIQGLLQVLCSSKATQFTLCEAISDAIFGFSGGQEPVMPSFLANGFQPTASRELVHLSQYVVSKKPRKFNFNTPDENLKVYGTLRPPIYNLSRVSLEKMSFYIGNNDILISPRDVRLAVSQLSVPYRFSVIGDSAFGVFFNHVGYFIHKRLNELSSIPVLMDVERYLQ